MKAALQANTAQSGEILKTLVANFSQIHQRYKESSKSSRPTTRLTPRHNGQQTPDWVYDPPSYPDQIKQYNGNTGTTAPNAALLVIGFVPTPMPPMMIPPIPPGVPQPTTVKIVIIGVHGHHLEIVTTAGATNAKRRDPGPDHPEIKVIHLNPIHQIGVLLGNIKHHPRLLQSYLF